MLAVRIHAKEDIRVEEVTEPHVAPGKVLLTGGYAGICGSDLHLYFAPESFPWDFDSPAKLTGASWPQILGHEFSGIVSAVGEGVDSVAVGDRVAVFPYHYCGECPSCLAGDYTACWNMAFEGIQGASGGMAEVRIADATDCFVLPETVDLQLGALVEPMSVAWHGVAMANPDPDKLAVIVGGGPIGVGAFFALRARGVKKILVSEPSAERREIMKRLGAEHVIDPTIDNLVAQSFALSGGVGADVVLDCAGSPRAFPDQLGALGLHGRLMVIAAYEHPVELSLSQLALGKTIATSTVYTREDFHAVIDAMAAGAYTTDGGWVQVITYDQVVDSITALRAGKGMKVLVSGA